jgi:hypothetical protein
MHQIAASQQPSSPLMVEHLQIREHPGNGAQRGNAGRLSCAPGTGELDRLAEESVEVSIREVEAVCSAPSRSCVTALLSRGTSVMAAGTGAAPPAAPMSNPICCTHTTGAG